MSDSAPAAQPDGYRIQNHFYPLFSLVLPFPDIHIAVIRRVARKVSVSALGMVYSLYEKDYQVAAAKITQWILRQKSMLYMEVIVVV